MTLIAAPVDGFGGLQLNASPGELPPHAAIDLSDVWFPVAGRVGSRPGYVELLQADASADIHSVAEHRTSGGVRRSLIGRGTGGQAYTTAGATQGSALTGLTDGARWSSARVGTPAIERTYIANGIEALRAYDESSGWSTPGLTGSAGVGTGKHVAVYEHRLANANFAGTTDDRCPSAIRFSDVANPNVYGTNNYVRVTPGDGEGIMGLGAWRDWLYAPKESKIAVFYGNGENSQGDPIFNFEMVETGIGMAGHGACCVGEDGFYFLARGGIYRIAGLEAPQRISQAIDPIFEGDLPIHYELGGGGAFEHAQADKARMCWHDDRLYVALACAGSTTNNRILMWDRQLDTWSIWRVPAAGLMSFRTTDQPELHVALAGAARQLAVHRIGVTDDAGATILSWWQGPYLPYAEDGLVVTRQVAVTGAATGQINVQLGRDYLPPGGGKLVDFAQGIDTWGGGAGPDTWGGGEGPDTWGPNVDLREEIARIDTLRGRRHSLKLGSPSNGGGWIADRATVYHYPPSRRRKEVLA